MWTSSCSFVIKTLFGQSNRLTSECVWEQFYVVMLWLKKNYQLIVTEVYLYMNMFIMNISFIWKIYDSEMEFHCVHVFEWLLYLESANESANKYGKWNWIRNIKHILAVYADTCCVSASAWRPKRLYEIMWIVV